MGGETSAHFSVNAGGNATNKVDDNDALSPRAAMIRLVGWPLSFDSAVFSCEMRGHGLPLFQVAPSSPVGVVVVLLPGPARGGSGACMCGEKRNTLGGIYPL